MNKNDMTRYITDKFPNVYMWKNLAKRDSEWKVGRLTQKDFKSDSYIIKHRNTELTAEQFDGRMKVSIKEGL